MCLNKECTSFEKDRLFFDTAAPFCAHCGGRIGHKTIVQEGVGPSFYDVLPTDLLTEIN